jgi:hypothetical protein
MALSRSNSIDLGTRADTSLIGKVEMSLDPAG